MKMKITAGIVGAIVAFMPQSSFAATVYTNVVNGVKWVYAVGGDGEHAEITGVDFSTVPEWISVPDRIGGFQVSAIGSSVFAYCHDVREIALPDCIKHIGANAFFACDNLSRVNLPARLETIGAGAFQRSGLTGNVFVPDATTNIARHAFYDCDGMESISIPGTVCEIGAGAFSFNYNLTEIKVREIAGSANNYRSIDGAVYSHDVKTLALCPGGKTSINIPASVETIDEDCFAQDFKLEDINVASGNAVFASVNGVLYTRDKTSLILCPAKKTYCTIQSTVTNICNWAFYMSKIESVAIPAKVRTIGECVFSACVHLESINVDPKNAWYKSIDGILYSKDGSVLVAVPGGRRTISVSGQVKEIGEYAFFSNVNMYDVSLPGTLRKILFEAFGYCYALRQVVLPYGVRTISGAAFVHCTELESVAIPASVDTIGAEAFSECESLLDLTISRGVHEIGAYAFADCTALTMVTIPPSVDRIGALAFVGCENLWYVRAPRALKATIEENQVFADCDDYLYIDYYDVSDCLVQCFADPEQPEASGTATMSPAAGTMESGTTVTLAAKAGNSDTVFAYWADDAGKIVGLTPTLKVFPEKDTNYKAVFRLKTKCETPELKVNEIYLWTDSDEIQIAVNDAAYPVKFTAKNLPTGLKIDADTGVISGTPTKPGVYKVTVSATNATVTKPVTAEFEIVVPNLACEVLPDLEQATDAYGTIQCGVVFDPALVDCALAEGGWTLKVAGLPAGLKFDAKTGTITGVPTAKDGAYTVTFTASKGKEKQTATITLNVESLPVWATGTFTGYAIDDEWHYGSATMTVAANGKISGKIALDGTNWTFSATSFSRVENDPSSEVESPKSFVVEAVAKAGKTTMPVSLAVSGRVGDGGLGATALPNAVVDGMFGDGEMKLWRNMWKDKATASEAKAVIDRFKGVYTVSVRADDCGSGYLSLTVGKDGNVKASGKLPDGTSASATSPLVYDEDAGWFVMLYAAPSAYKGGAFAAAAGFNPGDGNVRIEPVIFNPQWTSRNPQATGEYGEGFEREASFAGAYYDKLSKLNDYYDALRVEIDSAPELEYTYKETYLNGDGKKETESFLAMAPAADTLWQDGMTVEFNGKGALSAVKATKPVQDRTTKEWSYEGANDGALSVSFTQATGIFKGSYTFWYDYKSAYDGIKDKTTVSHTSKKVNFEGILVQGEEPEMEGFYLWDATGEYEDPKTGKAKTYKYNLSFSMRLLAE